MKRIILIAALILGVCNTAHSQNLLDALKGVATTAIEKVAGGTNYVRG